MFKLRVNVTQHKKSWGKHKNKNKNPSCAQKLPSNDAISIPIFGLSLYLPTVSGNKVVYWTVSDNKKGMKSVCCMLMCNFSNFRKHKNKYFFKMCAGNTNVHQQFSFSNQFQKFLLQKLCMFSVSFTSDVLVQISMFEGVQERRSKRMSVHSHL